VIPLAIIASEAKQSKSRKAKLDCFVASLLAMTGSVQSGRFLEQLPPDQHAPDLAGAGADLVKLGVAQ